MRQREKSDVLSSAYQRVSISAADGTVNYTAELNVTNRHSGAHCAESVRTSKETRSRFESYWEGRVGVREQWAAQIDRLPTQQASLSKDAGLSDSFTAHRRTGPALMSSTRPENLSCLQLTEFCKFLVRVYTSLSLPHPNRREKGDADFLVNEIVDCF